MEYVGDYIRKKRLQKNYSLDFIASELKISKFILTKIEKNEYDQTISEVFYLAHLRTYVKFLDLNANEIVEQFKLQNSINDQVLINEIPKPIDGKFSFLYFNRFLAFSSIIIIFSVFYLLFIDVDKSSKDYAVIPDIPEILEPVIEKEFIDQEIAKSDFKQEKKDNNVVNEFITSSSVIASAKIEKVASDSGIVTLKFLNPTWIQLRDSNDKIIISQLMTENDEYSYDLELNYNITAGNAGNVIVSINNDIRGKIGDFGQVIDSVVIDSSFNN
tara:strand:- start:72 stop:890 length:819 start_codon:yes stop_codon:yes gene_type:complete